MAVARPQDRDDNLAGVLVMERKLIVHKLPIEPIEHAQLLATMGRAMLENLAMLKKASEGTDWWDDISQAEKASIRCGRKDVKEGRTISDTKFMQKHAYRL